MAGQIYNALRVPHGICHHACWTSSTLPIQTDNVTRATMLERLFRGINAGMKPLITKLLQGTFLAALRCGLMAHDTKADGIENGPTTDLSEK